MFAADDFAVVETQPAFANRFSAKQATAICRASPENPQFTLLVHAVQESNPIFSETMDIT
jgi:hypothetical protein